MINKIIFQLFLVIIITNPLFSAEVEKLWGISRPDLTGCLKLTNYSIFKPDDKPGYSNRIIDFFNSMNPEERAVIYVLRSHGNPEMDYCFFNEKLYSVSEEWGNIDRSRAQDLYKSLKEKYAEISAEEKNPFVIYSFKKGRTKVLLYKKVIDEKFVNVRIFYYSNDIFNALFSE